jgi:hypothetical protein
MLFRLIALAFFTLAAFTAGGQMNGRRVGAR